MYAIVSVIMLVILCIWHSIIASIIFLNPEKLSAKNVEPTNFYVYVDRYMFISMFVFYIFIHILLVVWLIFVPYKRRREMEYLDREYAAKKHIQLDTTRIRGNSIQIQPQDLVLSRGASIPGTFPVMKSPIRFMKHSDGVRIIPNASTFLPIKEETNGTKLQRSNTLELPDQDDVFYENTK